MACAAAAYRRRAGPAAVLHAVVRDHLEEYLQTARAHGDGAGVPGFVERELRRFLTCGVLARGFTRVRPGAAARLRCPRPPAFSSPFVRPGSPDARNAAQRPRRQVLTTLGVYVSYTHDYDPRGIAYVVPRSNDCVLGGTSEPGAESLVPDDTATAAIRERCADLEPALRTARVRSVGVGLRPGRSAVRLEREDRPDGIVIHDYGHGGAGVTVSWGCADEVAMLACHQPLVALGDGLEGLPPPPTDAGRLTLIVRRLRDGSRETPNRVRLEPGAGVPGDDWAHRPPRDPDAALAVMREDVASLIAAGQPLTTFGDNLFVDFDISERNLPVGSTVHVGDAVVEVTPLPHNGCRKFRLRFGGDGLRFVAAKETRWMRLRGVYWKVLRGGEVGVGDEVRVLTRPPAIHST